jgi:legumain
MLFNSPTGDNVYNSLQINYRGKDVNKETFLAVLKGDKETAGGPVLESNAQSKVFIFYSDHGAPGLVDMPVGDKLYADELQQTFEYMQENNMYSELVFYLEACESGSMFTKLKDD